MKSNLARIDDSVFDDRIQIIRSDDINKTPEHGKIVKLNTVKTRVVNCAKCIGECKVF